MSTFKTLGERIATCRKNKHMTQADLAERLGLSQESRTTVAKWEHGTTFPPCQIIPDLCAALNCDAGYLFGEFDTPRKAVSDIQDETGLSLLAAENLLVIAGAPFESPMDDILEDSPHDRLRNLEIARFAKIRFVEAILENAEELERLAVAAYDYRKQMQFFEQDSLKTIEGIRHDQFAGLAKEAAKEALTDLLDCIKWDVFAGPEWGKK